MVDKKTRQAKKRGISNREIKVEGKKINKINL